MSRQSELKVHGTLLALALALMVVLAEREPPPLRVGRQVRGAVLSPASPLCRVRPAGRRGSGVCREKSDKDIDTGIILSMFYFKVQ